MSAHPHASRDIYQEVTDRILAALERGVPPWVQPWNTALTLPRNGATGRPYAGINTLLLWVAATDSSYTSPDWFTYRAAARLGGQVRKGEKGTLVTFWTTFRPNVENMTPGQAKEARDGKETRPVPFLKHFTVFNRAQIDGLQDVGPEPVTSAGPTAADQLAREAGADVIEAGPRAAYRPTTDQIVLPPRGTFATPEDFASTLLHELTHWTGHPSRLARPLSTDMDSPNYAQEELVAEMGAAFLCALVGLGGRLQHPEYLQAWLDILRADKKAIFHAASQARQVSEFLAARSPTLAERIAPASIEEDA